MDKQSNWPMFAKPVRPNAILFGIGAVVISVLMLKFGFSFLSELLGVANAAWVTAAAVGAIWTAFIMLVTIIISGYSNTMVQLVTDPPDKPAPTVPASTHEKVVNNLTETAEPEPDRI